jgi:4-hydroxy-tetrahydrodipicolinate reductase
MLKIGFCGAKGRMSNEIITLLKNYQNYEVYALWEDYNFVENEYIIYKDKKIYFNNSIDILKGSDIVIDFSHFSKQKTIQKFLFENKIKFICGTTNLDKSDFDNLKKLGDEVTVFYSPNMSFGINAIIYLLEGYLKLFKNYDLELVEEHHVHKKDAPSGTLKKILNKIKEVYPQKKEIYNRLDLNREKDLNEIGISVIRSGGIKGVHKIIFGNEYEIIEIKHEALDRKVFAYGVIEAIEFIKDKQKGFFTYEDLINEKIK